MSSAGASIAVTERERGRLEHVTRLAAAGELGIAELIALLEDPSWSVRRAVISALAEVGDAALEVLFLELRDQRSDETRIAATVDVLATSVGDVETLLIANVSGAHAALAADIAQILGRRRNARSVATLVGLLEHPDDNVAVAAIEALGRIGGRAAVDALVATVERQAFFRTYPAIDVLGRSGDPRAVAPLAELLQHAQYALEAARALGRTADRSAVAPLSELLASPIDATVRIAAVALSDLIEGHEQRYGSSLLVRSALKQVATTSMVRRVSQALVSADRDERVALCAVLGACEHEAGAPALTRMLDSGAAVAAAAAAALKQLGHAANEQLRIALEHGDSARRQILLPILPHVGGGAEVVRCLDDADSAVRALACDALARIGDASAVPILFEQLSDPNARVVQAAIAAIQSLGSKDTEALAIEAARSTLPGARRAALRVLSYFGHDSAIDVFAAATNDDDPRVRDVAIAGLALLSHPRARALLIETAGKPGERDRVAAMRGLGQSAPDPDVIDALLRGVRDQQPWVRYYACQSLGKLRAHAATAAIAALLDDPAGQVRVAAVEALSHLDGTFALDALMQRAAEADEPDIQRAALIGLGLMRNAASLPVIIAACRAPSSATRQVALSALQVFATPEVLAVLTDALADADDGVRLAALGLLAAVPKREATQCLIGGLRDERVRNQIVQALATPVQGRVEGLLDALHAADDELAPLLVSILGRVDPLDGTGAMLDALHLPNSAARKAAAAMLAAQATHKSLAALKQQALEDPSDEVRRVCALLLAH
jgi:HEAT repeat protein